MTTNVAIFNNFSSTWTSQEDLFQHFVTNEGRSKKTSIILWTSIMNNPLSVLSFIID